MSTSHDLQIQRGATFRQPFLFQGTRPEFRVIEAFQRTAPVVIDVPGHGIPNDWPIWLEDVSGADASMVSRPRPQIPVMSEAPDLDTLLLPGTNGLSLSISGGTIVFLPPVQFGPGTTAAMRFYSPAGEMVLELTEADGLTVQEQGRIVAEIAAAATAAIDWDNATYELDITFPDATVQHFDMGSVIVNGRIVP